MNAYKVISLENQSVELETITNQFLTGSYGVKKFILFIQRIVLLEFKIVIK